MVVSTVNKLSSIDAAYLAGLIDGEGTVTLTRVHRNRQRGLVVAISNTERGILDHVREVVGGGTITNKRRSKEHHTPSFVYHLSDRRALNLLEQISPFMKSHKAARSQLVLNDYLTLTPRNGRYSSDLLKRREAFVKQFFDIRPAEKTGRPRPLL